MNLSHNQNRFGNTRGRAPLLALMATAFLAAPLFGKSRQDDARARATMPAMTTTAPDPAVAEAREQDQELGIIVRDRLTSVGTIPVDRIQIQASGGSVTLSGTLDNAVLVRRAVETAKSAPGVRDVVNRLSSRQDRSDEQIRDDIQKTLSAQLAFGSNGELKVSVAKGVVVLQGPVANWQAKQLAQECAEAIPGVQDVRNDTVIRDTADLVAKASSP